MLNNIKLSAKNVTMLGNYHAEVIEVESDSLLVAGELRADDIVRFSGSNLEYMEAIPVPETKPQETSAPAESVAENPPTEPPSENTAPEAPQPDQAAETLPALADIGTTSINTASENIEITPEIRKAERAQIGIAADFLSDEELFFDDIAKPGGGTPPTAPVTETPVYPDVHQTLPNLPESQENPLI